MIVKLRLRTSLVIGITGMLVLFLPFVATAGTVLQEKAAALLEINRLRMSLGLASVFENVKIDQAAQSHVDYLVANAGMPDHFQVAGKPGFTGVTPGDRLTAAGYVWQSYDEVIDGGMKSGVNVVQALMQAIYHRFGILNTAVSEVGFGIAFSTTMPLTVIDFADLSSNAAILPASWRGTYPVANQTAVPVDFYSDTESPDPVPGVNRVGFPISFHLPDREVLTTTSFTLAPVGGANVATMLLAAPADAHVPVNVAAIVPLIPLMYDTNYVATFTGTRALGQQVSASWSFRTMPYVPLGVDQARLRVLNGNPLRIQVSGGEGAGIVEGNYAYATQWMPRTPTSGSLSVAALGNGLFEFNATQPTNAWVTFSDQQNHQITAELVFAEPVTEAPALTAGWNLLGNGLAAPIDVASHFGTSAVPLPGVTVNVKTVWKWIPSTAKWAFYTPTLSDGGLSYATSKGYDFLVTINPGEGYWINTSSPVSPPARSGLSSATVAGGLPVGWSMLAVGGEAMTPAALDKALPGGQLHGLATWCGASSCFLASGGLPATSAYKTLWTWSAAQASWRFYAPSLAAQGQAALDAYTLSKGYQTFDTLEQIWLAPGEGFWLNK